MKHILRAAAVIATAVTVAAGTTHAAHAHGAADRHCRTAPLAVSLTPGQPARHHVVVDHCHPRAWARTRAVDVFTDGASYTRYWDWPAQRRYSVAHNVLAAGRATVIYDRIGTGRSSTPPSTAVTTAVDAWILEQVLRSLRPYRYRQVTSWLHSYGSAVGILHAATSGYTRPDRLVVTGFLHIPRDPTHTVPTYPANQDQPAWQHLDDGWLTTRPGVRAASFHGPNAHPSVIRADEQRKDVFSATAFTGLLDQRGALPEKNPSRLVTADVVVAIGGDDVLICRAALNCFDHHAVLAHEAAYYPTAASLHLVIAPAGHSLALDPSATDTFRKVNTLITGH